MQEAPQHSNGHAPAAPKAKKTRKAKAHKIDMSEFPALPAVINTSGIWPTEFNVLIKQKDVEEVTKGGILIPEIAREKEQWAEMEGTLVAVSPLAFTYERWPDGARRPAAGDKVIIAKYSGVRVKGIDGKDYLLTKDKDITALRY
jgi:chaperonin GroES